MPDRKYLTEYEMERFLAAAKKGRHGERDFCMMLLAYRHGYRVSELIRLERSDLDLTSGHIQVRRLKNGLNTQQALLGDEMRALRAWMRARSINEGAGQSFVFLSERGHQLTRQAVNYLVKEIGTRAQIEIPVHPHMIRHSTGYALTNKGHNTRLVQDALGHRNIRHTELYTKTAPKRFEKLWE